MDNSVIAGEEAKVRALEQNESKAFLELKNYFLDCSEHARPYELVRVHNLLRNWLEARMAKIAEIQTVVREAMENLNDPKIIDKINKMPRTEILRMQLALSLAEVNSDVRATWFFSFFISTVFQSLTSSHDLPPRMGPYAPFLKGTSEALKTEGTLETQTPIDPFLVFSRYLKQLSSSNDETEGNAQKRLVR